MQKANKISALFFLGLFSLMLLHQVLPHLHHQHENSHSAIAHSDDHHHHEHKQEKEESTFGFFDFFMDVHSHSSFSTDILVLKRNKIEQQTVADKDGRKYSFDIHQVFLIGDWQNSKLPVYHPPNKYFNPYLSSLDLRGPPSLG